MWIDVFSSYTEFQQTQEKMLNVSNHQGNANKKRNITSHLSEWLLSERQQKILVRMWSKRSLIHFDGNVNWVQPVWKIVWRLLKKLKIELPHDPAIPLLGIYVRENKSTNLSRYKHPSAHSSMIYNLSVHQQMSG